MESRKIDPDLEFQGQNSFFLFHCILLIAKVKLFQGTIGRNLIVLLKNGRKVSQSFDTADACVLTAILLFSNITTKNIEFFFETKFILKIEIFFLQLSAF